MLKHWNQLALVVVVVLLAVAGCSLAANEQKEPTNWELNDGFEQLDVYLRTSRNRDSLRAAKKASSMFSFQPSRLRNAATYYVHLNEFQTCSPKTIKYMDYVLRGNPEAHPVARVLNWQGRAIIKHHIDRLLESSLVRAGTKCRTFIESWFRETEAKLDADTKENLYSLIQPDTIRDGLNKNLHDFCLKKSLSDPNTKERLPQMSDDDVHVFFENYIEENFMKHCKKYVEVMSPVLERARRLEAQYDVERYSFLFGQPSKELYDSIIRYQECKHYIGVREVFLAHHVSDLVDKIYKIKKSN